MERPINAICLPSCSNPGNGFIGTTGFFLKGVADTYGTTGVPLLAFWVFQFAFADTCSTITSGAMVGRCGFVGDILYSIGVTGFIYPIIGHWSWGPDGWLAVMATPFRDFAGSTVVHSIGGAISLGGAIALGLVGTGPGGRGTLTGMSDLDRLFENNAAWAARMLEHDPRFFARLQEQQKPDYLWIGCSDSRVPANEIVGLLPGELFVHRNVANVVVHTDLNCLSVLQFAIDVLGVRHVIVTGHYGCGGVRAVWERAKVGLSDNWLRHVEDVRQRHERALDALPAEAAINRLCELNVIEQTRHVCETTSVQDAWARGQTLAVHGWIYGLDNGRLQDLGFIARQQSDVRSGYERAVGKLLK